MSFVHIGTPQPIEESKDNKHLPIYLQTARDEQGRQRLHGAFQGGFSAGYFNTVGSEKGWQPSQFKSSRGDRHKPREAKPTDFMDEEDKREFGGQIKAALEYDVFSNAQQELIKQKKINNKQAAGFFSSTIFDDISQAQEIGLWLLKKMGWKPGQGIGKNAQDVNVKIEYKKDIFGIGFDPYKNAPASRPIKAAEAKKSINSSSGFGIGIFEDEDDIDFYAKDTITYINELQDGDPIVEMDRDTETPKNEFVRAKRPLAVPKSYKYPIVPKDYKPKVILRDTDKVVTSNVDERRERLNEPKIEGPKQPNITLGQQVKLKEAVDKINFATPKLDEIKIPKEAALAALNGFQPFTNDPEKHDRYTSYLNYMAGNDTEMKRKKEMSKEDAYHEQLEFSKAALIYRPLSKMMAARFTSETNTQKKTPKESSSFLQRTVSAWRPDRITCKRFGVAYKAPSGEPENDIYEKEVLNKATMQELIEERDRVLEEQKNIQVSEDKDEQVEEDEESKQEISLPVPAERPSMDLFKAIFGESDDEETPQEPQSFRPVFKKPVKSNNENKEKQKRSRVKLESLEEFADEEIVFTKKKRPTAADFM